MRTLVFSTAFLCAAARGAVYNIDLCTDSTPDYTSMDRLVESIAGGLSTDEEKARAVWYWACRGRRQTGRPDNHGREIWDPVLFFQSYGHTYCGYISGINNGVWQYMGYDTMYLQLPERDGMSGTGGHTVSEVSWDGETTYHMFDTAGDSYFYNSAARTEIADWNDMRADARCVTEWFAPEVGTSPHGYRNCNSAPWASDLDGYALYFTSTNPPQEQPHGAFAQYGHRYVLNLRHGEVYTRYYEPQGETDDYYIGVGGDPAKDPDDEGGWYEFKNIRGNGVWEWQTDLSDPGYLGEIYDADRIETAEANGGAGPALHPDAAGADARVSFKVYCANLATSADVDFTVQRATGSDACRLLVSTDSGINWTEVWQASSTGQIQDSVHLKGEVVCALEYLLRFEFNSSANKIDTGLESLEVTTVTQVNRRCLPALKTGENRVSLKLGPQVETATLWPVLHQIGGVDQYQLTAFFYENTTCIDTGRVECCPILYNASTTEGEDAICIWRMLVPTDIVRAESASRVLRHVNPSHYEIYHSWDNATYTLDYAKASPWSPRDENVWLAFEGASVPAGSREVYFKHDWINGTFQIPAVNHAGLMDTVMRVEHASRDARFFPVEVTFNWTEHRGSTYSSSDLTRSHTRLVTSNEFEYTINVAGYREPTVNWVRVNLKGEGPDGASVQYGYSDGTDVGTGDGMAKLLYTRGQNVAASRSYTSVPAAGAYNADSGSELTDGDVVPHSSSVAPADWPGIAVWEAGANPVITVDLGSVQTVGGVRVCAHSARTRDVGGTPMGYPSQVVVETSEDGSSWAAAGTIDGEDVWNPPADYLPHEYEDCPTFDNNPTLGKLACAFPLAFGSRNAQHVKFSFTTHPGRGIALNELQVFDTAQATAAPEYVSMPAVSAPAVTASATPTDTEITLPVDFGAAASGGAGGYSYDWDFGDGSTSTQANPSHPYAAPGTYSASVVVTDSAGKTAWDAVDIIVTEVVDSDGDEIPDWWEEQYYSHVDDCLPGNDDDDDGLSNLEEYQKDTHPLEADTDDDGIPDGQDKDPLHAPKPLSGGCGAAAVALAALLLALRRRRGR